MKASSLTMKIIRHIDLLDVNFGEYCLNIIRRENGEELLESSNKLLTEYMTNNALDPISGTSGIFRWVNGLRCDSSICDLSRNTKDVRVDIHKLFYNFVDKLKSAGYIVDSAKHDPNVADAVFMWVSIDISCDIMIEVNKRKCQSPSTSNKSSKTKKNQINNAIKVAIGLLVFVLLCIFLSE